MQGGIKTVLILSLITIFFSRVQRTCTCACPKSQLVETSNESVKSPILDLTDDIEDGNVSVSSKDYQDEQEVYELPQRRPRRPRRICKLLY